MPAPITVSASGTGDAVVDFAVAATDNSGLPPTVSCVPPAQSVFPLGTTLVKCTATDAAGNAEIAQFEVTVEDTTAPTVSISGDNPLQIEAGSPTPTPAVSASDNVDVVGPIETTGVVDTSVPGSYTLTYTARDAAGNAGTAELVVNVVDTTPPVLSLPAGVSDSASDSGTANVIFAVSATDNAAGDPAIVCTPPSGSAFGIGVTTVSCTATDASGLSASATFNVTVIDDTPPFFTSVPGTIVVSASDNGDAVVQYAVAAADNSGVMPTVVCNPGPGTVFALGSTPVSCSATDGAGNVQTAAFTVTVNDTTPPVLTLIGDDPLEVIAGTTFVDPGVSVTDNVGVVGGVVVTGTVDTMSPGTYVLTYSAADAAGNVASLTRDVVVVDETSPHISVPDSPLLALITGPTGEVVDYTNEVSISDDIDPSPTLDCTPISGSQFAPGTTTVACNGADASGNTTSAEFDVFVGYGGSDGINPKKTRARRGSTIPLRWAWQDGEGHNVDSSFDTQLLSIVKCHVPSYIVLQRAGDPGMSGFRIKSGHVWEFNWQTGGGDDDDDDDDDDGWKLPKGTYCAKVTSSLTGQEMVSPPIKLR